MVRSTHTLAAPWLCLSPHGSHERPLPSSPTPLSIPTCSIAHIIGFSECCARSASCRASECPFAPSLPLPLSPSLPPSPLALPPSLPLPHCGGPHPHTRHLPLRRAKRAARMRWHPRARFACVRMQGVRTNAKRPRVQSASARVLVERRAAPSPRCTRNTKITKCCNYCTSCNNCNVCCD